MAFFACPSIGNSSANQLDEMGLDGGSDSDALNPELRAIRAEFVSLRDGYRNEVDRDNQADGMEMHVMIGFY